MFVVCFSGGRRRKDPTADLPDLSRDELLAILDLIEKSGDSSGKSPVGTPTRGPTTTPSPSRYTTEMPTIRPRAPSVYPELPDILPPALPPRPVPTSAPTSPPTPFHYPQQPTPSPMDPQYPYRPTPPNFPAPTAPPPPNYPAPTAPPTPKPKKTFFEKLVRGFMKIIAPEAALNSRSSIPNSGSMSNFLESFLQQLQQANQNQQSGQHRSLAASTQQAVLDNLVKRLQGQNNEGSQFVVNLVQSLKNSNNPASGATPTGPVNARTGGQTEQFLGALLKGITSSSGQPGQTGGNGGFLETFQRELVRAYNPSAGPTGQRSTGDVLVEGFKQFLQKNS